MRLLLDTCVVTELRKPNGNTRVKAMIRQVADDDLFISVLTIGEIVKGVGKLPIGPKKQQLTAWLSGLQAEFGDRILPVDIEVAEIWGQTNAIAELLEQPLPPIDGLIAATALRHDLAIATRNIRDFNGFRGMLLNPWLNGET